MGVPVWLEGAADVGTVAAGLALPLAFFQLGGLRRDRLRGQVERVAPWAEPPQRLQRDAGGGVVVGVGVRTERQRAAGVRGLG